MRNWHDLVSFSKRHEIFNDIGAELKAQEEELRNAKPAYEHHLKSDRNYNKEHAIRVSDWKARHFDVSQKLRKLSEECYAAGNAYADEICVGTPPEEYAGKNVAKWKECETYKIEAIEINTYEFGGW